MMVVVVRLAWSFLRSNLTLDRLVVRMRYWDHVKLEREEGVVLLLPGGGRDRRVGMEVGGFVCL